MANLAEKLDVLSKKLEDKKKADEVGELERVRREAKEEAAKGDWANMDILNQKLVLMESLATKLNHSSQKEMTMILVRFHANKFCPGLASQLILKFLSTKEEKGILDEEQKTVKQYGYAHPTAMQMMRPYRYGHYDMQQMYPPQQQAPPFHPWARAVTPPPRMRYHAPRAGSLCFKCQKPGHQIRNCPN